MIPVIALIVMGGGLLAFRIWEQSHKTVKKLPSPKGKMSGLAIGKMYSSGLLSSNVTHEEVASALDQLKEAGGPLKSPFQGVSDQQWFKFVTCMYRDNPGKRIGVFAFSPLRIRDLTGSNNRDFSIEEEYKLLIKSLADYGPKILELYNDHFGKDDFTIDSVPISLSGLLAVAHYAGLDGMQSWVEKERDRKKFTDTTGAFQCANGIF